MNADIAALPSPQPIPVRTHAKQLALMRDPGQVDAAGIDILLVGDSVGMVVHGHDTTLPVTLEDMLLHCRAVSRGARRCGPRASFILSACLVDKLCCSLLHRRAVSRARGGAPCAPACLRPPSW